MSKENKIIKVINPIQDKMSRESRFAVIRDATHEIKEHKCYSRAGRHIYTNSYIRGYRICLKKIRCLKKIK